MNAHLIPNIVPTRAQGNEVFVTSRPGVKPYKSYSCVGGDLRYYCLMQRTIAWMADQSLPVSDTAVRQRRLDLAKKAFREFYAQCFWSYREETEITEDKIAFVIRGLREHGGLAGYQIAAELCH